MSNTKDWTTPNENAEIDVPDELMPLFNQIGTQIRLHTISGKNEVLTIAHCVRNADRFFHSRISELEGKVEFYRRETSKLRDYLEEHKIGKPSQKLFDALYEHIAELEAENKRLRELIQEAEAWLSFNMRPDAAQITHFRKSLQKALNPPTP